MRCAASPPSAAGRGEITPSVVLKRRGRESKHTENARTTHPMSAYLSGNNNSWLPRRTSERTNRLTGRLQAPCSRGSVGRPAPRKPNLMCVGLSVPVPGFLASNLPWQSEKQQEASFRVRQGPVWMPLVSFSQTGPRYLPGNILASSSALHLGGEGTYEKALP